MAEINLDKAIDDISIIKGVIEKTSFSFKAFSKIFIYWGILFLIQSIYLAIVQMNLKEYINFMARYSILNYTFPTICIALIAIGIYWFVTKKKPLIGLEKHLIKIWVLLLILNILPPRINIDNPVKGSIVPDSIIVGINNLSTVYFSLAIGLIITAMFTKYKKTLIPAIIYLCVSFLNTYTDIISFNGNLMNGLNFVALPFTFLFLGIYLKIYDAKEV